MLNVSLCYCSTSLNCLVQAFRTSLTVCWANSRRWARSSKWRSSTYFSTLLVAHLSALQNYQGQSLRAIELRASRHLRRRLHCPGAFYEWMGVIRHLQRVIQHKCYIVATCDKDLKRRIRKVPGVPIMYIRSHRCSALRACAFELLFIAVAGSVSRECQMRTARRPCDLLLSACVIQCLN